MSLASGTFTGQKKTASATTESAFMLRVSDPVIAGAIFLVCLAYLCLFLRYSAIELDEGIVLQGAERVLRGEIPYRDFFTFYTPGSFYLVALVFRIFGDAFIVARLSIAVCGAICSVITYVLARRVCSPGIAIFCAVLATITGAAFRFLVLHNPYSSLFVFCALYAAVRALEARRAVWMLTAGSFASFSLLTEQSKGVGVIAGILLAFAMLKLFYSHELDMTRLLLGFGLGVAWPPAGTFAYFAEHHSLSVMLQDWQWPLQHYTKANHVVYGYQNWSAQTRDLIFHSGPLWLRAVKVVTVSPTLLVPVLPLVAIALLGYLLWNAWSNQSRAENFSYYILTCSVSAGLLASVVVVRPDSLHFMYLAPVWYVILAWILGAEGTGSKLLHRARPYLFGYVALAFGMLALASLLTATGARHELATRRGMIRTNREDMVIPYVQAHTTEKDRVLVYPYLPLYNYLTGTLSSSRYDFFQPGMNTPDQAQEIIASLKTGPSVLLQPAFTDTIPYSWADTPLKSIVNDSVTDYLARHYRTCKILKSPEGLGFWWMVPKDRGCS